MFNKEPKNLIPAHCSEEAKRLEQVINQLLDKKLEQAKLLLRVWDFLDTRMNIEYTKRILRFFGFMPLPPSVMDNEDALRALATKARIISANRGCKDGFANLISTMGYGSVQFDYSLLYSNVDAAGMPWKNRVLKVTLAQSELGKISQEDASKKYSEEEQRLLLALFRKFSRIAVAIELQNTATYTQEYLYDDVHKVVVRKKEKQNV